MSDGTVPRGYSGSPQARKLGLKPGLRVALDGSRLGWTLDDPPDLDWVDGPADVIVAFVRSSAELGQRLPGLAERIFPAGGLWIAWPRRVAGHVSDLTDNVVHEHVLPLGLVDVKVAAIDEDLARPRPGAERAVGETERPPCPEGPGDRSHGRCALPHRATPAAVYHSLPKAAPISSRELDHHHRVRHDVIDKEGKVTLRHQGRLFHIGVGRTHARTPVLLLVQDLDIRVVHALTGELLRALTLDPSRSYQPTGRRPRPSP